MQQGSWDWPGRKDSPSLHADVASELEHPGVLSESHSGSDLSIGNIKIKDTRECKSVVSS